MTSSIPEETTPDNAYQKTLTTGCETDIKPSNTGKSPAQMKEWSILSDHIKYITSDKHKTFNKHKSVKSQARHKSIQGIAGKEFTSYQFNFWQ